MRLGAKTYGIACKFPVIRQQVTRDRFAVIRIHRQLALCQSSLLEFSVAKIPCVCGIIGQKLLTAILQIGPFSSLSASNSPKLLTAGN